MENSRKKLKVYVGYSPFHYTNLKIVGLYRICYIKRRDGAYKIRQLYFYSTTHNKITKLLTDQKILEIIEKSPKEDYCSIKSYKSYEEAKMSILKLLRENSLRWEIHEILLN